MGVWVHTHGGYTHTLREISETERDGFMKCHISEVCMHCTTTVCYKTPAVGDHTQQRLQNNVGCMRVQGE